MKKVFLFLNLDANLGFPQLIAITLTKSFLVPNIDVAFCLLTSVAKIAQEMTGSRDVKYENFVGVHSTQLRKIKTLKIF